MVAHHDEPTVPDWNINKLAREGRRRERKKKKKKGARVNVSQSVCCILPHALCEQHLFLLTDEREAEGV